jgi:hypothetical protein
MSVLKNIRDAIELRLRSQTAEALKGLEQAATCVNHLLEHGCTVEQITVRRDYVVIDIDQPSSWLQGSICVRRFNGPYREVVMVTKVLGCQVQWIERELHPLLRREG